MFPKIIKLILALLTLAYGIYQFVDDYIGNGIMLLLLSGMFVLLYFKNEIIFLAFLRLRKQDFEGTQRWLMRISNVERNSSAQTTRVLPLPFRYYSFSNKPHSGRKEF